MAALSSRAQLAAHVVDHLGLRIDKTLKIEGVILRHGLLRSNFPSYGERAKTKNPGVTGVFCN
jgi:hypothetical protein